ncbi:MAG: FUSC family protein [Terracidiphilus sp.]|nr:FUSC family protein [Terracidiphilus sp.]
MAGALRTTLALVITIVLLMVLRIPAMAFGVFLIFLVSYETPYLTFQRGVIALSTQGAGAIAGLFLVAATGNIPIARVFGVALFAFIAAFIRVSSIRFIFQPMDFAVFAIGSLECFDTDMRDSKAVSYALWPLAAGAIAVSSKIAVEYIFTRRNPYFDLYREVDARLTALKKAFLLFSSGVVSGESEEDVQAIIAQVRNYAFMGQGKMHSLLQEIEERRSKSLVHDVDPASIPLLARLLDLTAAYTVHNSPGELSIAEKEQMKRLSRAVAALQETRWDEARENLQISLPARAEELDHVEHSLSRLVAYYAEDRLLPAAAKFGEETRKAPRRKWLAADCWTNPEYAFFSFKVSLCAMICFVIYDALKWQGISTAVITVMVASLDSSGATNQKLLYRFVGSTIGGVILGLGSIIFVFPYTDSIVPYLIAAAIATFIGAWVIRCPHYGYIGLQIAFSYYLVVFTGFSGPTNMAPARDRLIGILLALIVMMFFFRPEKSVDAMQRTFARLLRAQADYLNVTMPHLSDAVRGKKTMELKSRMETIVSSARGFTEVITYEFSTEREEHMRAAEKIERAIMTSGDLLLSISSWPREADDSVMGNHAQQSRSALKSGLLSLAAVLGDRIGPPDIPEKGLTGKPKNSIPSYIENSLSIYRDLDSQCRKLASL